MPKIHKLRSNFCEDLPSSVLNFDEIWHTLRQNTALSVGTASANFVKETTSQSGSSALAVPQESPYSASANSDVLLWQEAILWKYNQWTSSYLTKELHQAAEKCDTPREPVRAEDPAVSGLCSRGS